MQQRLAQVSFTLLHYCFYLQPIVLMLSVPAESRTANNKNDKSFNVIPDTTLSDPQSKEKNY